MKKENEIGIQGDIGQRIYIIRGQKVMLAGDLSILYGVRSGTLIQAVKRNQDRFPSDFCFQLSLSEAVSLKSQFVTSKMGRGGTRYRPYAFTEHGIAMLSAVLRSDRAVAMSIFIVRAFIKLREALATNKDLAHKVAELEHVQEEQGEEIESIHRAVAQLIGAQDEPKEHLGFKDKESTDQN